jgi:hypothetical protein
MMAWDWTSVTRRGGLSFPASERVGNYSLADMSDVFFVKNVEGKLFTTRLTRLKAGGPFPPARCFWGEIHEKLVC